jgi:hypothetical protein
MGGYGVAISPVLAYAATELAIPPGLLEWLTNLSLPGAMVLFALLLATNRIYTSGQVNKMMESKAEVAKLWEQVAIERQETIKLLTEATAPVIDGNEAILRALERIQTDRQRPRGGGR